MGRPNALFTCAPPAETLAEDLPGAPHPETVRRQLSGRSPTPVDVFWALAQIVDDILPDGRRVDVADALVEFERRRASPVNLKTWAANATGGARWEPDRSPDPTIHMDARTALLACPPATALRDRLPDRPDPKTIREWLAGRRSMPVHQVRALVTIIGQDTAASDGRLVPAREIVRILAERVQSPVNLRYWRMQASGRPLRRSVAERLSREE